MRTILLSIGGAVKNCQKTQVFSGHGMNGNTYYPQTTCPHFRQFPNGNDPVCLIFQKDVRTPRSLEKIENGLTKRLPECCAAEKDAGRGGFIQINIVAGEKFCERVPIIKTPKSIDKKTGKEIPEGPNPWINDTAGFEKMYYPDQVCDKYVSFASHWCRIFHDPLSRGSKDETISLPGGRLYQTLNGLTNRLPACIRAEEEQKK